MTYTDETLMPIGKHKNKPLKDVPASYLIWLRWELRRDDWRDLQAYIDDNMDALKLQAKTEKR